LDLTKQPLAALMIQSLSQAAKLQFIITTHKEALKENADTVFIVKQKNGISSFTKG
jgi:chromosome segregation ATPase